MNHRYTRGLAVAAFASACIAGALPAYAQNGGTLTWAVEIPVTPNFDPHKVGPADWLLNLHPVYDTLIRMDATTAEMTPGLATSWRLLEGEEAYELKLREGVVFHDGTPFDAAAVKANLERARDMTDFIRNNAKVAAAVIADVEIVDEHTVIIHRDPDTPIVDWGMLETNLSQNIGMMISPAAFDNADLDRRPVGTGPFTVESYVGEVVIYSRFPDFWDAGNVSLDRIIITNEGDGEADFAGLATGQYHITTLEPTQVARAQALPDVELHEQTALDVFYYSLNEDRPPFDNLLLRQAFFHAIDRQGIVDAILPGAAEPTSQMFPPNYPAYDPAHGMDLFPYDPERAASLVAEAGYPDGVSVQFEIVQSSDERGRIAEVVEQMLGAVGINATHRIRQSSEPNQFLGGTVDSTSGVTSKPDPLQHLASFYDENGALNPGKFKDDTTQDLLDRIAGLSSANEERWDLIRELSGWTTELAYNIPFYVKKNTWATRCVDGFTPPISGSDIRVAYLTLQPGC